MESEHIIHIAVGCFAGAGLFAALLIFGAGMQWATAAFVVAMLLCHAGGFYYLKAKNNSDEDR